MRSIRFQRFGTDIRVMEVIDGPKPDGVMRLLEIDSIVRSSRDHVVKRAPTPESDLES